MNFSGARGTFPIQISIHSDRLSIQIYGQKTDLKVLNILSIKTYQIFPTGLSIWDNKCNIAEWEITAYTQVTCNVRVILFVTFGYIAVKFRLHYCNWFDTCTFCFRFTRLSLGCWSKNEPPYMYDWLMLHWIDKIESIFCRKKKLEKCESRFSATIVPTIKLYNSLKIYWK